MNLSDSRLRTTSVMYSRRQPCG